MFLICSSGTVTIRPWSLPRWYFWQFDLRNMGNHRKHLISYAQFGMQFLGATSQTSKIYNTIFQCIEMFCGFYRSRYIWLILSKSTLHSLLFHFKTVIWKRTILTKRESKSTPFHFTHVKIFFSCLIKIWRC